jgi:hypothetical protein
MTTTLASQDYPLLNLFWTTLIIFLWILWFFILFRVILDIFRSHDMGGWGKAGWLIFVCVLPYLGVFVYLIARGSEMQHHDQAEAQKADQQMREYVRSVNGNSQSTADELTKLAGLHDHGVLSDTEFENQKAKLLA